jgi:hypothetical protein
MGGCYEGRERAMDQDAIVVAPRWFSLKGEISREEHGPTTSFELLS